jgi:hypothetical protein
VCIATQMWQWFLVAIVMTTTSRATGSSVVFSKIALSLRKPSTSCGDAAIRAIPAGRYPRWSLVAVMNRRAAGGADSMLCSVKNVVSADMMIYLRVR